MIKLLEKNDFMLISKIEYTSTISTYVFEYNNKIILIDFNVCQEDINFTYTDYCNFQNDIVYKYKEIYRFLYKDSIKNLIEEIDVFLKINIEEVVCNDNGGTFQIIHIDNTPLEHKFEELFTKTYGVDSLQYLTKEEPISTIKGTTCFADYLISTNDKSIIFEENGVNYHHPMIIKEEKYQHQLDKQNTLNLLGYQVYRLSTENMLLQDQTINNIKKYIGEKENLLSKNNIKLKREFKLYPHQNDLLNMLDDDRKNGVNTTLIVLPTGSGKSHIIVEDFKKEYIKNNIKNILIMVPTTRVKNDWINRFDKENIDIFCYNKVYKSIQNLNKDHYDYIVFDEAHHASAANCKKSLQYFTPKYLIGLTATPQRLDNKKIEEIFGEYESTLTLKEAIDQNILCNIRCFRLISNIDLTSVRYNGVDYNYSDLEKTLLIDSRNNLIVNILYDLFLPKEKFYKQGLIFCVNKNHAIKVANLLKTKGFKAEAVYGGNNKNDEYFEQYKNKEIQFLCSCQLISEGFDSPQTEVVVMARPTLSKVLYLQQIGRGTRKYEGKESLLVIDVVDNYSAKLNPWNFNSIFKLPHYHDFIGIKNNTQEFLEIYGLNEHLLDLKEIDIFTFEEKFKDLISLESAARELYIGTKTLESWVKKNDKYCDSIIPIGKRLVPFFTSNNIDYIRKDKKLSIHSDETILRDFIDFIDENNLTFSYKLIYLISVFKCVSKEGQINIDELLELYKEFYLNRLSRNLNVDRNNCPYTKEYLNDKLLIKTSLLNNPFEKFERKRFFYYSKDLNVISFNDSLWKQLNEEIIKNILYKINNFLEIYYESLGGL